MMLSSTVMPLKSAMFWNVRATPRRVRAAGLMRVTSRPSKRIVPCWGRYTPLMQLSKLVLPAPLGPMIAASSPGATEKPTPCSAVTPPKRKERFAISSSAIVVPRGAVFG